MPTTVLIADDQAMVRAGFAALLGAADDITVLGDAEDGQVAVDQVRRLKPDVVLMDVRMPRRDGLWAAEQIISSGSATRVLMLTTFDIDDYVYAALRIGASGFLLKDAPADELVRAVRVVAAGDALLAPSVTRRLIEQVTSRTTRKATAAADSLTPRELEVLLTVADGKSNGEIAAELFVSEQTVKTHVSNMLAKLGLRDRAQAVVFAYENGLK
ncbi:MULTISPECIES: response regulator [Gordonia]|uniref:Response regulator transcription factor n=2 Tax=Gordonia TaxID=2053 RepID=A0ABP5UW83_9ACTN|nr:MULTISPECIES: response regulator transcription factor [Gordonia]AUH68429.1 DNA-binding response regulator [Gordonia sp. YC-JH1]KJR07295.1 LuxR family transcriptional regulator [Gordonia sihwensis]KXT57593.1 LuxR family transcriptional regulator [Gordonia sp. QH-12]MBY4571003.1 DNA-binding response regulator [Gordonia sihwensis]WFN91780.1 response regulator transcription factor [Gordonia sihwensis]